MLASYHVPDLRKAIWQMCTTFVPFVALWALAAVTLRISYWLALPLVLLAALLFIRLFIIQHDCGHGSFFAIADAPTTWSASSSAW